MAEYHGYCSSLHRLTIIPGSVYQRFYSDLRANPAPFIDAVARSPTLLEVSIDHAVLATDAVVEMIKAPVLKRLTSKWADPSTLQALLETAKGHSRLEHLTIVAQDNVYMNEGWTALLASTRLQHVSIYMASCRRSSEDAMVTPFGQALRANQSISRLSLTRGALTDARWTELAAAVQSSSVADLQMPSCQSLDQARALAALLTSSKLTSLDLSPPVAPMADKDAMQDMWSVIAAGLLASNSLRVLNLSRCRLTNMLAASSVLQQALAESSLECLVLSYCHLSQADWKVLRLPSTLRSIDLTSIPAVAVAQLEACLPKSVISANLSNGCQITNQADIDALRRLLSCREHVTLGRLAVHAPLADSATEALVQSIIASNELQSVAVTSLGQSATLGAYHIHDLLMGVSNNNRLRSLTLISSAYSDAICADALKRLLAEGSLSELDLTSTRQLGEQGLKSIAEGLRGNSSLRSLRLAGIDSAHAHSALMTGLYHALTVNSALQTLDLRQIGRSEFSKGGWVGLCKCLPHMSLQSLVLDAGVAARTTTTEIESFLVALEQNYSLYEVEGFAQESMEHWLKLNRCGRHVLREGRSDALLADILAQSADDQSVLFYFVRQSKLLTVARAA